MAPLVTAIREPQQGGSQAFVSDLARGLVGRGHDVHVYAASGSEILRIPTPVTFDVGTRNVSLSFEKLMTNSSSLNPATSCSSIETICPTP